MARVLSETRQPIVSVASPISTITYLHKDEDSAPPAQPQPQSSELKKTISKKTSSLHNYSSAPTKQPKTLHEHAKRNQRRIVEGRSGKGGALSFMYRHQIDVPLVFISMVLVGHFGLRIPLAGYFLFLQNRDPISGLYSKTWTDFCFIFFWIVMFTFMRAFVMTMILKPFAIRCGIRKEHRQARFQEEGWVCLYYTASWIMGMYVLRHSPAWNNWYLWFRPAAFFEDYPLTQLPHVMIWTHYVQFGFWLQQVFVLHIEVPRKDFWALLAHHIVTLLLIGGSALSNFWRAGNAVFVVMDVADILLAFSKSMKYLGVKAKICDCFFGVFMVSWLYTRHYMYAYILHGFMFTAYEIIPFEFDIMNGKWYIRELAWLPILGLALLQMLMIYWFALILRIVVKILKGQNAEDERSDDEQEPVVDEKAVTTR